MQIESGKGFREEMGPEPNTVLPWPRKYLSPGCLSDNIMLGLRGGTLNIVAFPKEQGIAVLPVVGLHNRSQGWTLGKTCNRWGQQGLSEESAEPPAGKIASAGRANIDRDISSTNGLALGQTSSSSVSLGHIRLTGC